jgi:4-hydroxy-tetrahydrodipicolinate synthase
MAGNIAEAEAELGEMEEGINLLFKEGNPVGAKAMAAAMGITSSEVRLPLVEATNELSEQIKSAILRYDLR